MKKLIADRAEANPAIVGPPAAASKATSAGTAGSSPAALKSSFDSANGPAIDEAELFKQAFEGVRRLGASSALRIGVEPTVKREVVSEDAEVMAELSDLVSGQGPFELTETEEYVEGMRVGLDPRLVTRLRRGEFSVQAHLDLHGMTQIDAKEALAAFVLESARKGRRAVLVVHGRGLRSPGGQPVLKHATAQWLSHGTIGGYVLAFTTARAYDGGTGAMWVLLRRERRRAKFDVLQGTKRRD
ncbi:MAG: Smr/MutS family protein [Candidatus Binataceae bacterium]